MILKCVPLALCLLLCGCGGTDGGSAENQGERAQAEPTKETPRTPAKRNPVAPEAAATSAVAASPAVWIGTFAATPQLCSGGAWKVSRRDIVTAGETACTIRNVAEDPEAVRLTLSCSAEGMDTLETWTLTPREENGLKIVRAIGGKSTVVDLVRCG